MINFYLTNGIDLRRKKPEQIIIEGWNMCHNKLPVVSDEEWNMYDGKLGKDFHVIWFNTEDGSFSIGITLLCHPKYSALSERDENGFINQMKSEGIIVLAWKEIEFPKITLI